MNLNMQQLKWDQAHMEKMKEPLKEMRRLLKAAIRAEEKTGD